MRGCIFSLVVAIASTGCWARYSSEPAVARPDEVGYGRKVDFDQAWGQVQAGIGAAAQTPADVVGPSLDSVWRAGIDGVEFCVFSTDGIGRCAAAQFDEEPDAARPFTIVETATRASQEARTVDPFEAMAAGVFQPGMGPLAEPAGPAEAADGAPDDADEYVHVPADRAVWMNTGARLYRCSLEEQAPVCRTARM